MQFTRIFKPKVGPNGRLLIVLIKPEILPFLSVISIIGMGIAAFSFVIISWFAPQLIDSLYFLIPYTVLNFFAGIVYHRDTIAVLTSRTSSTDDVSSKRFIAKAPGTRLLALVDFLFRPATVELTFKQVIANWRQEYFDALKQGRTLKARWVTVRYRVRFACTFIMAMGLSKVFSIFKQLSK